MKKELTTMIDEIETHLVMTENDVTITRKVGEDIYTVTMSELIFSKAFESQVLPIINKPMDENKNINFILKSRRPATIKEKRAFPLTPSFEFKCRLNTEMVHLMIIFYTFYKNLRHIRKHFVYGVDKFMDNSLDIVYPEDNDNNYDFSNGLTPQHVPGFHPVFEYNIRNIIFPENIDIYLFEKNYVKIYDNIYFDDVDHKYIITNPGIYKRLFYFIDSLFTFSFKKVKNNLSFDDIERFYNCINKNLSVEAAITVSFGGWVQYNQVYQKFFHTCKNLDDIISSFVQLLEDSESDKDKQITSQKTKTIKKKDIISLLKEQERMISGEDDGIDGLDLDSEGED
jgi:hypothetical protein